MLAFTGECEGAGQTSLRGAEEAPVELQVLPPSAVMVQYSSGDKCRVKVEEVNEVAHLVCLCVLVLPQCMEAD